MKDYFVFKYVFQFYYKKVEKILQKSMLIIPSKQLLLLTAQQSKEIFLFDAKTTSVLTKYHTQPSIGKPLAYYPHANQFITSYTNKTFLNIWSTDSQQSISKVSTSQMITFLQISKDKNILFAGSQNGSLFIWQLPTGILIRKSTIHSGQVKKIIEYKPGYLMTSSKNEVKFWNLASFYIQTERSTPIKIINSILDIIDVQHARNIFVVLTSKSATYYLGGNEHNPFPQLNKQQMQFPTTVCTSLSHFYIGNFQGSITVNQIVTSQNSYQINFSYNQATQQMQLNKLNKKIVIKGQNKYPITCLIHLKTLPYLISGNTEGQISVWQNHVLKKSMKLFKTSIKFIFSIPKPLEQKIVQSLKIRPLAKYEQNKQTQPLQVDINKLQKQQQYKQKEFDLENQLRDIEQDAGNELILDRMLQVLNRPQNILKNRIQSLQQQKQMLIKTNLHYSEIICQQNNNTSAQDDIYF